METFILCVFINENIWKQYENTTETHENTMETHETKLKHMKPL